MLVINNHLVNYVNAMFQNVHPEMEHGDVDIKHKRQLSHGVFSLLKRKSVCIYGRIYMALCLAMQNGYKTWKAELLSIKLSIIPIAKRFCQHDKLFYSLHSTLNFNRSILFLLSFLFWHTTPPFHSKVKTEGRNINLFEISVSCFEILTSGVYH